MFPQAIANVRGRVALFRVVSGTSLRTWLVGGADGLVARAAGVLHRSRSPQWVDPRAARSTFSQDRLVPLVRLDDPDIGGLIPLASETSPRERRTSFC